LLRLFASTTIAIGTIATLATARLTVLTLILLILVLVILGARRTLVAILVLILLILVLLIFILVLVLLVLILILVLVLIILVLILVVLRIVLLIFVLLFVFCFVNAVEEHLQFLIVRIILQAFVTSDFCRRQAIFNVLERRITIVSGSRFRSRKSGGGKDENRNQYERGDSRSAAGMTTRTLNRPETFKSDTILSSLVKVGEPVEPRLSSQHSH
jgi:hypothetical protein